MALRTGDNRLESKVGSMNSKYLIPVFMLVAIGWGAEATTLDARILVTQETPSDSVSNKVAPLILEPSGGGLAEPVSNLMGTDLDGQKFDLRRYAAGSPVVIALTSTSCPLCKKYGPTLAELESEYKSRGIKFVFIGSISSDSADEARLTCSELGLVGPYIMDGNQALVRALRAESTTEVFVLDRQLNLRYRGAVDDQYGLGYTKPQPTQNFLREALQAVIDEQPIKISRTTAPGCKIALPDSSSPRPLNYHRDVERIVQNHCVECHREGGVGPFSLVTADEVSAHAGMIMDVVRSGTMPPWFAAEMEDDPHRWANDAAMPESEKQTLIAWLESEQVLGDVRFAPTPRTFESEWEMGTPDLVVRLPQRNRVQSRGYMDYVHQRIPMTHTQDLWFNGVEIRPTAREVVHHVLVYALDRNKRDVEIDESSHFLAAYAPGNSVQVFPDGLAKRLPANCDLLVQMHYTPNGRATHDQTEIGFQFQENPPESEVMVIGIADTRLGILPNAAFHQEGTTFDIKQPATVTAFFPHMHLRGKAFRFSLKRATPSSDDSDESEIILDVPNYDFNWQLEYRLLNPLQLNAGDVLEVTGWFDNSRENPSNPNPETTVRWGKQTDEEMLIGYVEYLRPATGGGLAQDAPRRERRARRNAQQVSPAAAFERYDKNKDGVLSPDESPRPQLFELADENKDGQVTPRELEAAWSRLTGQGR